MKESAFHESDGDRYFGVMPSPLGNLLLFGDGRNLTGLRMDAATLESRVADTLERRDDMFAAARAQLDDYFAGVLRTFSLRLAPRGTPFQRQVWQQLVGIPYGETRSYGAIAAAIGEPGAARAVGLANGRNPISLVIPCHRVIGRDGSLTGYAWGLHRKDWLLAHEASVAGGGLHPGAFMPT